MRRFLSGLAARDDLGEADRERIISALHGVVVEKALADYQASFRHMAGDVPEFGFWAETEAGHTGPRQPRTSTGPGTC